MFGANPPMRQPMRQPDVEPRSFAEAIVEAIDGRRKKKVEEEPTFNVKDGLKRLHLDNLQASCVTCLLLYICRPHIGTRSPVEETLTSSL